RDPRGLLSFPTRRSSDLQGTAGSVIPSLYLDRRLSGEEVLMDLFIIRLVFITVVAVACWQLQPFGLSKFSAPVAGLVGAILGVRSEEHTSELQSRENLVC